MELGRRKDFVGIDGQEFPKAAVTKLHKLGGFKEQNYRFIVPEARSPKLRCQQSRAFSETCRGDSYLLPPSS